MTLLTNPNQIKIDELNRKLALQKQQAEKKLTRQKILLGSFLLDMLENNRLDGARQYTVDNLDKFLTRSQDKELLVPVIEGIKRLTKDNNKQPNPTHQTQSTQNNNQGVNHG